MRDVRNDYSSVCKSYKMNAFPGQENYSPANDFKDLLISGINCDLNLMISKVYLYARLRKQTQANASFLNSIYLTSASSQTRENVLDSSDDNICTSTVLRKFEYLKININLSKKERDWLLCPYEEPAKIISDWYNFNIISADADKFNRSQTYNCFTVESGKNNEFERQ